MITCPKCGSRVGADGNCQSCLLQLGISQHGSSATPPGQFSLPTIDQISAQFPQLEIKRLIGRGGMGAIYQARQTALDRDVALKLIAREVSNDPMFVERFEREAKALAKLSHPNIVTVFDFGRTSDGMAYLVMEFVDGVNLREAIATRSVGSEDALDLVATMCKALEYAHSKGVVHRDIKPENILLGEDGSLKIADFGIAKIVDDSKHPPTLTATRQVLGSLHYLAPEQIESPDQVDHRVDLYALGVIFYELLTGQLPLGRFEPPSAVDRRVDQRIDAIVMKTLHRKPSMRYQSALQIESDIQQVRTGGVRPASSVGDSQPTRGRTNAVPFQIEMFGGMAHAKGMAQATPEGLRIEYRVADAIWGGIKSQLHSVLIPAENLVRVALRNGVFSSSLNIVADSITVLGQLPGSETGEVVLTVKKSDRDDARNVVQALGFGRGGLEVDSKLDEPRVNPVQAILLTICGILNAGWLATVLVFVNQRLAGDALVFAVIGVSICFGLMAALQIISGILHATLGVQAPYRAAMIISMVPMTPVVLFSIPLAIWYWNETKWADNAPINGRTIQSSKSWGATTMMYLRENRKARIISILNGVGMVIFAGALGYYYAGLYQVEICYRIIPDAQAIRKVETWDTSRIQGNPYKEADVEMVIAGVRARLADMNGLAISTGGTTNRLYIHGNRYQKDSILDGLRIEKSPQLVLLAASTDDKDSTTEAMEIDVVQGLSLDGLSTQDSAVGNRVHRIGEIWNLDSLLVRKVDVRGRFSTTNSPEPTGVVSLQVAWTTEGRKKLQEKVKESNGIGGIGLMVDGVVRGIAKLDKASSDEIEFQLNTGMKLSAESIMAAIRGPSLPFELEQLK